MKTAIYSIIGVLIFGFFWFIYDLYTENQTLTLNNQILQNSVSEQQKVIDKQKRDIEEKDNINNNIININHSLTIEKNELQEKFTKEKTITTIIDNKETKIKKQRDIGKLALSKSDMVQKAINKGTIKEFKCIEAITNPKFTDFDNIQGVLECK